MKRKLTKLLVLLVVIFSISLSVSAQIYVKVRPAVPIIVKPIKPSQEHVWIDEDWESNSNAYQYTGGHWEKPPHVGYIWKQGHWKHHNNRGDEWIHGSWRKQ
jgi:nitric oxide reductase large subunit